MSGAFELTAEGIYDEGYAAGLAAGEAARRELVEALRRIEMGCSFPEDDVQKAILIIIRPLIQKHEKGGGECGE